MNWAAEQVRQRGHVGTWRICRYVCVLENMESVMCVSALVTRLCHPTSRRMWLSMLVFYVSPVCRLEEVAMLLMSLNRHHLLLSDLCKCVTAVS